MTDPKPEWPDDDRGVEYDMMIPPSARIGLHFPASYWAPTSKEWIEACKPLLERMDAAATAKRALCWDHDDQLFRTKLAPELGIDLLVSSDVYEALVKKCVESAGDGPPNLLAGISIRVRDFLSAGTIMGISELGRKIVQDLIERHKSPDETTKEKTDDQANG